MNGTIPHEQNGKFGGARVFIRPAAHGTGVIAGGAMRAVLESVGVHDVLAKSKGSSNPHNVVKATIDALVHLRDAYTVAEQRNVSIDKFLTDKTMAKIKLNKLEAASKNRQGKKRPCRHLGSEK